MLSGGESEQGAGETAERAGAAESVAGQAVRSRQGLSTELLAALLRQFLPLPGPAVDRPRRLLLGIGPFLGSTEKQLAIVRSHFSNLAC